MNLFFEYELPEHLIAQHPAERRDDARLLVVHRATGVLEHRRFRDLPELLNPGDRLVLNNTKVIPARLIGQRLATGGAWEALFLGQHANGDWELLAKTRGYPQPGEQFRTETGLTLTIVGRTADKHWLMRPDEADTPEKLLTKYGEIPLPPYIRKGRAAATDSERYQTVFASTLGSVAAPTAGLHFTPELLARLTEGGVARSAITLHVGIGTFAPIKTDEPTQHTIHSEWCEVLGSTADEITQTKQNGGRIIAVGTTTTRTLESAASAGRLEPYSSATNLFIRPPFEFRVLDAIITNFHLPRTTLLLLVQAFSGSELLRHAYAEAIRHEYRFYSYGDAMLIM